MKNLWLIDGSSFIFRAYFALPTLTRSDGVTVNAVLGFCNIILKLLASTDATHLAVVFDTHHPTFRHDLHKDYKGQRKAIPIDLVEQIPLVKAACKSFNINTLESKGFEADDLIATYAVQAANDGAKVRIISSDKDLLQLLNDSIEMYDPMKDKVIGPSEVQEKYGVPPKLMQDIQSLMGDSVDGIKGVPGIGPKTAANLINQFGSLDKLLKNYNEISNVRQRELVASHIDDILLARQLVTLRTDVPLERGWEDLEKKHPRKEEVISFCHENAFNSLLKRVMSTKGLFEDESFENTSTMFGESSDNFDKSIVVCENTEQIDQFLKDSHDAGSLSIYNFNPNGNSQYLGLYSNNDCLVIRSDQYNHLLNHKIFKDDHGIKRIGFNVKDGIFSLGKDIWDLTFDDILIQYYLLNGPVNLGDRFQKSEQILHNIFLSTGFDFTENVSLLLEEILDKKESGDESKIIQYVGMCSVGMMHSYLQLNQEILNQKLSNVYFNIELPLIKVLKRIESRGILVDNKILSELDKQFIFGMQRLEEKIYSITGEEFNIGSPKQLSQILFEKMNLGGGKKGKSGAFSTDSKTLENLSLMGHEIADHILAWRQLSKLKSTYVETLPKCQDHEGRVRTTLNMCSTNTGRLSSTEPNLQNIPIRSEEGRMIRKAFIAKEGYSLVRLDYSQIELRLMAEIGNVEGLKEAFKHHEDVHLATAINVFKIDPQSISKEELDHCRRKAKTINFGVIYGISSFGLSQQLHISKAEAANYIESYFHKYPEIRKYMDEQINFAVKNGYVRTHAGRICKVAEFKGMTKQFAERQAINAPLQGTAADIIKKAMIKVEDALNDSNLDAQMILQVHDELIFECKDEDAQNLVELVKPIMESAMKLEIPLEVDSKISKSWE